MYCSSPSPELLQRVCHALKNGILISAIFQLESKPQNHALKRGDPFSQDKREFPDLCATMRKKEAHKDLHLFFIRVYRKISALFALSSLTHSQRALVIPRSLSEPSVAAQQKHFDIGSWRWLTVPNSSKFSRLHSPLPSSTLSFCDIYSCHVSQGTSREAILRLRYKLRFLKLYIPSSSLHLLDTLWGIYK